MYLNAHTHFSLKYGTLSVGQLVQAARDQGIEQLALTDINNTSATLDFIRLCQEARIHPVVGIEFRREHRFLYVGLARNAEGFYQLNRFLTECSPACRTGRFQQRSLPDEPPILPDVVFILPWGSKAVDALRADQFIGVRPHQLSQLFRHPARHDPRLVALNAITLAGTDDYELHKTLQAIDQNSLLSKVDLQHAARQDEYCQPEAVLSETYGPFAHLLDQAQQLLQSCTIEELDIWKPKNKQAYTNSQADDLRLLRKLAEEGFRYRYGDDAAARQRLEKEVGVIRQLGFTASYLIVWDVVRYARSQGFHHVGRGSAANSIVAFCLGITDVDPVAHHLYFERFINPHRAVPPDFDIDFSWDERDDVLNYLFGKYGEQYVAFLGTYVSFEGKAAIREVAKTFGLPKVEIDKLVAQPKSYQQHHHGPEIMRRVVRLLHQPSHLSMHAGGILVSEVPLTHYTALQMMPKGFPITHFDMHTAEDYGFFKFDILSQRGLGHIKMAVDLIRENQQRVIDIHRVQDFMQDERVKEKLRNADAIGCFYIESPAMRQLLGKLQCDDYSTLVAASSVIRPGVAKSGMMKAFITRHHNPASVEYLHPIFEEHLGETYGVMVYQEDVMKIAHHFGGIALDDTDILRRAMSGKTRGMSHFDIIRETYFANCRDKGYTDELAQTVWHQMESFAGYSFCKAHSASYAVESFQSLFLKTYFPLEFITAVINNFGGFYRTELYVHEARMAGGSVHAPCINRSHYLTHLYGTDIFLGLVHLKDLEAKLAQRIVSERKAHGDYQSLADFIHRIPIGRKQLELLIRIGAFRFSGRGKQQLLWEKNDYLSDHPTREKHPGLFDTFVKRACTTLPTLEYDPLEEAFEQIDLLGFPLSSPFDLLKTSYRGEVMAQDLPKHEGKTVRMVGYFIARKPVRTKTGKAMGFGTWIDVAGNFFDTVHFPQQLQAWPFEGIGCYLIESKVVIDFGVATLEVSRMKRLPMKDDPRYGSV